MYNTIISFLITIAPLNKLILSSNIAGTGSSKHNAKFTLKKSTIATEKKGAITNNYLSTPTPIQQISSNLRNQIRIHNKNSTSMHISSNKKQSNQSNCYSTTSKPQGKSTYSYCNTISSTNNTDNNNNINNAQIEARLLSIIDQMQSEDKNKVEFLNSNIFLNKLISYFSSLISPEYQIRDLIKNDEIKSQFNKLEHKISYYSLYSNFSNANVLNADMLSSDYISETNPASVESNNRKDVYKTFFEFFDEICKEIKDIFGQLPEPQELKLIEEVNSKISSLHSKITLTNKNIDCNESSIHTFNMFQGNEQNYNLNMTKENMTNVFLKKTLDLMSEQVPSILISSINSEFYQQLINDSLEVSNISKVQTINERKLRSQYPCDDLAFPLTKFEVISPINPKPPVLKDESKLSDKTIQNEESCYDQTVPDEMKVSTLNIKPNDYCHTKAEYEQKRTIPIIKKVEDKCNIF